MNQKVIFKDLVVTELGRKESDSDPDIYITAGNENGSVGFCVESYLTGPDSEAYKAADALKVGDVVDICGFLYWYNNPNPHVTAVAVKGNVNDKGEGAMTYEEFLAAEKLDEVTIEAYVQGKQSYYAAEGTANVYLADADGALSGNLIDEFIRAVIIQIKLDIPVSCLAAVRAFLMVAADFLCAAVTAVPVSPAIALFAAGRAFDQITADIRPVTLRAVPV